MRRLFAWGGLLAALLTTPAVAWGQSGPQPGAKSTPPVLSTVPTPPPGAVPEPAQMSGFPLQVGDLPPGIVAVRVIRRNFQDNVANQPVQLRIGQTDRVMAALTNGDGRTQFEGLKVGDTVRLRTAVGSELLESQSFEVPAQGGVRLVLAAGVGAGAEAAEPWPATDAAPVGFQDSARRRAAGDQGLVSSRATFKRPGVVVGVGALLAMAGVVIGRRRRQSRDAGAAPAAASQAAQRRHRRDRFERLVRLEEDREQGIVEREAYEADRQALISELIALDAATSTARDDSL